MEIFSSAFSATSTIVLDYKNDFFTFVEVAENAEKKISIKWYHNKYFYGTFNSNFSLQNINCKLSEFYGKIYVNVEVAENAEEKISI